MEGLVTAKSVGNDLHCIADECDGFENRECNHKGTCNIDEKKCNCEEGFLGANCE